MNLFGTPHLHYVHQNKFILTLSSPKTMFMEALKGNLYILLDPDNIEYMYEDLYVLFVLNNTTLS